MKTNFLKFSIILLIALFTAFCSQTKKGQDAEVGAAQEAAAIEKNAETYKVNTQQSVITWIGSKPTGQHNGTIQLSEGSFAVLDNEISGGSITIAITSLEDRDLKKDSEDYKKLTGHLMSDDFFAADQYPDATFEIVSVVPFDSTITLEDKEQFESDYTPATMSEFIVDDPTHYATGNLTLRGVTKSVKFPARINLNANQLKAEAKFNIDRTEWNLNYQDEASVADKVKDKFIYNTVNVGFSISALKESDPSL